MSDAFKPLLGRLADGQTLTEADADDFFGACLRGEPTPAQVAAALTAMRMRGETVSEITAGARQMRAAATKLDHSYDVIDVCGTGGDGLHTLNVSTAVAFVVAGAGVKVAKHGNRALSSKSGTADVLSALGVNIDPLPGRQLRALEEANICFLFAQAHHGAMKHVSPIRQQLGFRTLFNLLGPLTNPAGAKRQVVGVYAERWVEPLAQVLGALGAEKAWVVHGMGMDELATHGPTSVAEWSDGRVKLMTIRPEALGILPCLLEDIRGGGPDENAAALTRLLDGQTGPYRDIVLLNAAAALMVADKCETLADGMKIAADSIDEGLAKASLMKLVEISSE
ncbi:MAG: anthranilate phosphoribosyltransferase [Caulobacter sp.]